MQTQLLAKLPSDQLRVYAVWIPMLWSDSRAMWNGNSMSDARVLHFWDGECVVGQWIAQKIDGYDGITWDAYYLFGPKATRGNNTFIPGELGGTSYGERENLATQVTTLLEK